ncbi:hypothetical protein PHYBOEH_005587 [Phytophthora boehmeriae]|uniref:TKL protein kinase n=1 Tax=Phytophthora boehmeriae TaxID=109152 RepID=A0A8T1WNV8_9STRA|nr:hypothetical protein PHYBOEH_005587 [Phytophthora boehmeriae]
MPCIVSAAFLFTISSLYGLASAYSVFSYHAQDSCAGSPTRVDVAIQSDCAAGCHADNRDWASKDVKCDQDYKKAVWKSFRGASFILQEALTVDCGAFLGASAFLASGECEKVISDFGLAAYAIVSLETDSSASIRYFSNDKCTTPLRGPVRLTENIEIQDAVIDASALDNTNVSCDANGYRWSSYKSSSRVDTRKLLSFGSCGSPADKVDCNAPTGGNTESKTSDRDDSKSIANTSTASSDATRGTVKLILGTIVAVMAVVALALAFIYRRFRASTDSEEDSTEPRLCARSVSAFMDQNSPTTQHQQVAQTPRKQTETRKARLQGHR